MDNINLGYFEYLNILGRLLWETLYMYIDIQRITSITFCWLKNTIFFAVIDLSHKLRSLQPFHLINPFRCFLLGN